MNFISLLIGMIIYILAMDASATNNNTYPSGCKPIGGFQSKIYINSEKQNLILLHNISDKMLWMRHPESRTMVSVGWTSKISKDNWSALAVNKRDFVIECIEAIPGLQQQVACNKVIQACIFEQAVFSSKSSGSYWVSENRILSNLIARIESRFITLSSKMWSRAAS